MQGFRSIADVHSDSDGQSLANGRLRNDGLKIEPATRGTRDDYQLMPHTRTHASTHSNYAVTRSRAYNSLMDIHDHALWRV